MASCLPRQGDSASVGGVGAVSGFRPAWRDVGTKPGFVAWSAGDGGVGDFDGSRAVWRHAGHQLGFGACSGWELAARCCSSRGWGESSPALVQVDSIAGEPGSQEGVVFGFLWEQKQRDKKKQPLLGAYADLPLSPLPPEEDLLVLLGDKPTATDQNPSLPLKGTEQEGQPSLETFLGEKSPHSVTVLSEGNLLSGLSVESKDQTTELGFQGRPQQLASGSLEEVPDAAPLSEEAGSVQPQGTSSGVCYQRALGTLDFGKCPYPSYRFERQSKKRSMMVDHALSSHVPWYTRGDVTCLQCHVTFLSALSSYTGCPWVLAWGARPEGHRSHGRSIVVPGSLRQPLELDFGRVAPAGATVAEVWGHIHSSELLVESFVNSVPGAVWVACAEGFQHGIL